MLRFLSWALAGLAYSLLAACATVVHDPHETVDAFASASVNEQRVQCLYATEWQFNHQSKQEPPALGVALSGGGMRSASYSMGVLKALHDNHWLEQVDVISAVSGGAYTAGWYFAQKARTNAPNDEQLFNDDCKRCKKDDEFVPGDLSKACVYQRHLEQHSKIVTIPLLSAFAAADFVTIPANLITNFIFGWHFNTTPHRWGYEHVIGQEFFFDPVNSQWLDTKMNAIDTTHGVPYLIINTTAAIDDDINHHAGQAQNAVFEYTPLRYGSDAFGYLLKPYDLTIHHVVSISAAALDLPSLTAGAAQKTIVSALNFDLGSYKNNYNFIESRPEGRLLPPDASPSPCEPPRDGGTRLSFIKRFALHWVLPFPLYFFHHYKHDSSGIRMYLTDGGHSDNTGAFSLIRRMTGTVLIVDASQDPDMRFDDYYTLKRAVESSLHAKLSVPAIDRILQGEGTFHESHPVMIGSVTGLPYGKDHQTRKIKIIYVKLSIDRTDDFARYKERPRIKKYYEKHLHDWVFGHFPFQSTVNQSYTSSRFRAYRDLGYLTIMTDVARKGSIWTREDDSPQPVVHEFDVAVCGAEPLNPTRVMVHHGDRLSFNVTGSASACKDQSGGQPDFHECAEPNCAHWTDGRLTVDANGWEKFYLKPFWFLKRVRSAHWYELSGTIVDGKRKQVQTFAIGVRATIDVKEDGDLYLFGNDATGRYGNNEGVLRVHIRQIQ